MALNQIKYYTGQHGQDINVIYGVYKGKRDGFFVEVGGYDGVTDSNTFILEKQWGWNGIIVECNPMWEENIRNHRSCKIVTEALWNEDGKELTFNARPNGCSSLKGESGNDSVAVTVKTKKLTTILDEANAPNFIEYLSLDVEGAEYEVLSAHDFDKYKFGYITVEHNFNEDSRQKVRTLLEKNGYKFVREHYADDEYALEM